MNLALYFGLLVVCGGSAFLLGYRRGRHSDPAPKTNWTKVFTDPSSGEPSMSRGCFGLLITSLVILVGVSLPLKWPMKDAGGLLLGALGITAGVYGANSVMGAWKRAGSTEGGNLPEASPESINVKRAWEKFKPPDEDSQTGAVG